MFKKLTYGKHNLNAAIFEPAPIVSHTSAVITTPCVLYYAALKFLYTQDMSMLACLLENCYKCSLTKDNYYYREQSFDERDFLFLIWKR